MKRKKWRLKFWISVATVLAMILKVHIQGAPLWLVLLLLGWATLCFVNIYRIWLAYDRKMDQLADWEESFKTYLALSGLDLSLREDDNEFV